MTRASFAAVHETNWRGVDVWRGAIAGAIGGAAGSSAMVLFNHLLGRTGFGRDDRGRHDQQHRAQAKPNDSDGTIADEPSSRKAASRVTETVTGTPLDERGKDVGGPIVHHAFGAATGAAYGALAAMFPVVTRGGGLPYGVFVWLAAAEAGLPLTGLARSPATYPAARHVASLATHLVFGATLEASRRRLVCGV